MLVSLAGVVKHGREICINDQRTNRFKVRLVTVVRRPTQRNDDIVCAIEALQKTSWRRVACLRRWGATSPCRQFSTAVSKMCICTLKSFVCACFRHLNHRPQQNLRQSDTIDADGAQEQAGHVAPRPFRHRHLRNEDADAGSGIPPTPRAVEREATEDKDDFWRKAGDFSSTVITLHLAVSCTFHTSHHSQSL